VQAPKRLKVFYRHVPVLYLPRSRMDGNDGIWDQTRITIAAELRGRELADTFLHEVLHAIRDTFGHERAKDEDAVQFHATAITTFWSDNPSALRWWAKLISRD